MGPSELSKRKLDVIIAIVAIGMSAYHLTNCYVYILGSIDHVMVHLSFALLLIFLDTAKEDANNIKRSLFIGLIFISLGILAYLHINMERLLWNVGFPLPVDIVLGFIILIIVLWACKISFGLALPLVAVFIVIYGFFAYLLGGPILSTSDIISTACLTFGGYDLFGKILRISANVIFLFILYSGLLQALKATDFFIEVGKIAGMHSRSGPAMAAVIASALTGTVAGQATPNIAVTGAFTIPLMKRVGYKPEVAGSIEAAASGGGQIMPPIMGAGAFVMADLLGVSYSRIVMMAIIPALLYFLSIGIFVHLHAVHSKVEPLREEVDIKRLYSSAALFIVPLIVILILLFKEYPPMLAAFWGIGSLVIMSLLRKDTRPSLGQILSGLVKGATTGSKIAVAAATLGPIIALMTKTGLGMKIGFSVEMWSGGSILVGLVILMIAVIIIGLEVPTVAAYLIAAIVAVPSLVRLGLNPYQAHMFAFYFASFSGLTPPVGMAAVVASRLADAPYIRTALHSLNAAAAAYLLPFVFVFNEDLLLLSGTKAASLVVSIVAVILGLLTLQTGFVGQLLTRLTLWERLMMVLSGLTLLHFAAMKTDFILILFAVFVPIVIVFQIKKFKFTKLVKLDN